VHNGFFDHLSDGRLLEPARSHAAIELVVGFGQVVWVLCKILLKGPWKAVGQTKSYELYRFGRVEMR
jgi:hypothetical protein